MRNKVVRSRRYGISLIEILVALVVLLVAILGVIRIFPPGFLINQHTQDFTEASNLAAQETSRFAASSQNLMDAVVPVIPVTIGTPPGYAFKVDLDTTPDDLSPASTTLAGVDPYYYSDVNRIRRVVGEHVAIPVPTPTSSGLGSVYLLSSGPIYNVPWNGQTESVFVSGAPLQRVETEVNPPSRPLAVSSPNNVPTLSGPQQYAVDYDNHQFFFFPLNVARQYLISYSYYDSNNVVQTVVDEVLNVPANTNNWVTVAGNLDSANQPTRPLVAESDVVARKFTRITPGGGNVYNWSNTDPYEYDVLTPNQGAFSNVGVMVFNPLGHNFTEFTPSGAVPLTARLDYDVLDWHIISEDRPMPASGPYQVHLSLQHLKQLSDLEDDQTPYQGIFRDPSIPAGQQADLVIMDINLGMPVPTGAFTVDYRLGNVTFTDAFGAAHTSNSYRFYYKAHGDWAVQIQKAAASYRRHLVPTNSADANVGLGEFYVPANAGDPGNPTRMYFSLMDSGKTITAGQLYYMDSGGISHKVSNESFRINANPTAFQNLSGRNLTWVDIKDKYPDAVSWDARTLGQPVVGVQGVSFRSRVIWNNGSNVQQFNGVNVVSTRWRRSDIDGFLTRGQGQ